MFLGEADILSFAKVILLARVNVRIVKIYRQIDRRRSHRLDDFTGTRGAAGVQEHPPRVSPGGSRIGRSNSCARKQRTSNYFWNTIISASIVVRSFTQRIGGSGLIYGAQRVSIFPYLPGRETGYESIRGGTCWNVTSRRVLELFSQTPSAP